VTLIEQSRTFTACPFSNEVIAGLRNIEAQQFTYDRIAAEGVTVIAQTAVKVDPQARRVGLADGSSLGYDRLVLAPALISSSTHCPAMTRPPLQRCRMPGRPAFASRSRPIRTMRGEAAFRVAPAGFFSCSPGHAGGSAE
jgi:hypothetical protein